MLFSTILELSRATSVGRQCKAIPGTLSLQPSPPAAVCHPEWPEYNATACETVNQEWMNIDYHAQFPLGYPWTQFNNDSCIPTSADTCTRTSFPIYIINATCKEDLKKGVDFARENKVRLVRYDYIGRSSAPNSLSIWTRYIQGISFHDSFEPQGCKFSINSLAATIAAGMNAGEANLAASLLNLTSITTGEESVGYGGYITGGGHGFLAPAYGLIADLVLEMEIVMPSGDIVAINECQNQGLFWAMRGK